MFVRMMLGFPRKRFPGGVEFDVSAENEADRAVADEGCDSFRAGKAGAGVVDEKTTRHQKVARKE